jgi:hypothetical protein
MGSPPPSIARIEIPQRRGFPPKIAAPFIDLKKFAENHLPNLQIHREERVSPRAIFRERRGNY